MMNKKLEVLEGSLSFLFSQMNVSLHAIKVVTNFLPKEHKDITRKHAEILIEAVELAEKKINQFKKEFDTMSGISQKYWCCKCDISMENKGVALDCPEDGIFYECPKCNYRIVILKELCGEKEDFLLIPEAIESILDFVDTTLKLDPAIDLLHSQREAYELLRNLQKNIKEKYHLAKNLGLSFAKPDRHLVRIANLLRYNNVQDFCMVVSELSHDKIGVVDLVFWRFANITQNYLEVIKHEAGVSELIKNRNLKEVG